MNNPEQRKPDTNARLVRGFTLTELLIYLAIFGVISGLFLGILATAGRVQKRQVGVTEVSNQINFVMQTIQRLVRESSAVIVNNDGNPDNDGPCLGQSCTHLVLRMKDSGGNPATDRDPIVIWKETDGTIKIQQGGRSEEDLTTEKVRKVNNALAFTKYVSYPGQDAVGITLTLNYNAPSEASAVSKTLQSAVGRASAAMFDSELVPGTNDNFDIGTTLKQWKDLFLSGTFSEPGNYSGPGGRGYKIIGYASLSGNPNNCYNICAAHNLTCDPLVGTLQLYPYTAPGSPYPGCTAATNPPANSQGLCYCE